jgi:hypothetical protein
MLRIISLIAFTVSYPGRRRDSPRAARPPHSSELGERQEKNNRHLEDFDSRSRGADSKAITISAARLHFL